MFCKPGFSLVSDTPPKLNLIFKFEISGEKLEDIEAALEEEGYVSAEEAEDEELSDVLPPG